MDRLFEKDKEEWKASTPEVNKSVLSSSISPLKNIFGGDGDAGKTTSADGKNMFAANPAVPDSPTNAFTMNGNRRISNFWMPEENSSDFNLPDLSSVTRNRYSCQNNIKC